MGCGPVGPELEVNMNSFIFSGALNVRLDWTEILLTIVLVLALAAIVLYLQVTIRDHIKARVAAKAGAYVLMITQKRDRIRNFRRTSPVSRVQRNGYLEYYLRTDRFTERYDRFLWRALIVESSDDNVYKKMSRAGLLSNFLIIPEIAVICGLVALKLGKEDMNMAIISGAALGVLGVIYIICSFIRGDKDVKKYAYEYGIYDGVTMWLDSL